VVERVPCEVVPSPHAEEYLKTKKEKLGHLFASSKILGILSPRLTIALRESPRHALIR
jgi:hypothetical protein